MRRADRAPETSKRKQKGSVEMAFLETIVRKKEGFFHRKSIGKNAPSHQCRREIPQPFRYSRRLSSLVKTNSPKASGTWKFGTAVPVGLHAE